MTLLLILQFTNANCVHEVRNDGYTCLLGKLNIISEDTAVEIFGNHLDGRLDDDIVQVFSINSTIQFISSAIFYKFEYLKDLVMTNVDSREIKRESFCNCYDLTGISFENNSLLEILARAFESCPQLKQLTVQNNLLTNLDDNAFYRLGNLEILNLPT